MLTTAERIAAERTTIAAQLGIPPANLDVIDDDHSHPGYTFWYFSRMAPHPDHPEQLIPEIRMVRLYVGSWRAFLERRWLPDYGFTNWAIVCPDPDISEREVAAVWKARSLAFEAEARFGRPPGPTAGSKQERWQAIAKQIGLPAAKALYDAETPRRAGRSRWWQDNVARPHRRRKLSQK